MKPMKVKAADALIELHASITDITDFKEFPTILESLIKQMFHIDWLGIFFFSDDFKAYNIVTNPCLPFDWNEKYNTIADFDVIRKNTFSLDVGKTYLHDTVKEPDTDEEIYTLETVKKYTDTSQFLTMLTGKTNNCHAGIGLYRTDNHYYFNKEEKQALDYLSPVLVSVSHMMRFYSEFDFKRVAMDELRKTANALTMTLNESLLPVDIPAKTKDFLNQHFPFGDKAVIPEPIDTWIKKNIAPKGRIAPNTGPWLLKLSLPDMNLYCKAFIVITEFKQLALLISFIPHGQPLDFSVLSAERLTPRETDTLSYLPLGYTNRQIAMAMGIEEVTVKKHLKNAAKKLGALGRTESLYQAIRKKELLEFLR